MNCPVCDSEKNYHCYTVAKYTPALYYRKCADCLSYFQYPNKSDIAGYYTKEYYAGTSEYAYHDERRTRKYHTYVWNARLRTIRRFQKKGKLLDVGCSFGGFVEAASRHFDSYGLDVSKYAVNEGNVHFSHQGKKSILFEGDLLHIPRHTVFSPGSFNVISLIEVIEHLASPIHDMKAAFELLKPGGMLVIQTANFSGMQAVKAGADYHYFLPGHLTCFTSQGLKKMLLHIGFTEFKEFIPVDFNLLAKLRKSRGSFKRIKDYTKWYGIIKYHMLSYIKISGVPLNSSYVLYAIKP